MAKFNQNKEGINITTNKSGHTAYKMEDKEKLVSMVLTSMFGEQKYYGDNTYELMEVAKTLIDVGQGQFVANLAVFARNEMNLRSVSHALCALLAHEVNGKEFTKYAVNGCNVRADDITEILACYISMYGKPIANSLKKALANCMNKYSEYNFAKYNGGNKSIKFKDVLMLTHAKAKTDEQNALFGKIITDTLETPYTWETQLSKNGNNKETWEDLIASDKVGYMALLRNLRNIIQANPNNIDLVLAKLCNKDEVLKSKQLPFRFYSAYKVLKENSLCTSKILDTLEIAIRHSVENIKKLSGTTLIAIDVSGSMKDKISSKSDILCSDIACLMASIANAICENSIIKSFDTRLHNVALSTVNGIISNVSSINVAGGGTNISLPIGWLISNNVKVDRIIILSDNEINSGYEYRCQSKLEEYKSKVNSEVWLHAIDLQGYGTQQFKGKNVNIIAGWSEKVFEFIDLAEQGLGDIVNAIEIYDEVANVNID